MKNSTINYWLLPFFLIVLVGCFPGRLFAATEIEFILDSSGSMKQQIGGRTQIDLAREALLAALSEIPSDTHAALRVYAHRVEQSNKPGSCEDTELVIPFGPVDMNHFKSKLTGLKALGYTPIAYSLAQAGADFLTEREADKVIILLSDGEETCGGNPVDVIQKLKAQGINVTVHTIGFNVDQKTRLQLQGVAAAGGGQYFNADNAATLTKSLADATRKAVLIKKTETVYGSEIKGGDSFETAVALEAGRDYRLNHHQRKDEYDYFKVDLTPGQAVVLELKTYEKGLEITGQRTRDTEHPYAGIRLLDPNREEIKKKEITGNRAGREVIDFSVATAGTHYVLLGSAYAAMHKDHVTFKLQVESKGDLGGSKDAGDKSADALPIEPGNYPVNYIAGPDEKDMFSFKVKKGEQYSIGLIPEDGFDGHLAVRVFDSYKRNLLEANAERGAGLKTDPFTATVDGTLILEVSIRFQLDKMSSYALELEKVAEAVPSQLSGSVAIEPVAPVAEGEAAPEQPVN